MKQFRYYIFGFILFLIFNVDCYAAPITYERTETDLKVPYRVYSLINKGKSVTTIINKTILPPSKAGIGNKFVTPSESDIIDIIFINSNNPDVWATTSEIPTGPIIWSKPIFPVNSFASPSIVAPKNSPVLPNANWIDVPKSPVDVILNIIAKTK